MWGDKTRMSLKAVDVTMLYSSSKAEILKQLMVPHIHLLSSSRHQGQPFLPYNIFLALSVTLVPTAMTAIEGHPSLASLPSPYCYKSQVSLPLASLHPKLFIFNNPPHF